MTKRKPKSKLNERQAVFVEAYVESMNAYQSAIKAGYSESTAKNAYRALLESATVCAAIEKRLGEIEKQGDWTVRRSIPVALTTLVDVAQHCKDGKARVNASREILDRTKLIRREGKEVNHGLSAEVLQEILAALERVVDKVLAPQQADKFMEALTEELEAVNVE